MMGMARSLLKSMSIPGKFWGEAVRHSIHLLNWLPTKAMGSRTPFEVWHGCKAHAKVTTSYLKKLDMSLPMVYLDVEDGSKAHRLVNPQKGAIHVSRDVIFEESAHWNWNIGVGGKEPSSFVVEEPQTREFSRTPTVAIATGNTAIARGDQGAIGDLAAMTGYPSISVNNHATTKGNGVADSTASTTPSRSTSGNDAVASTMPEIAGGDESNDGPICYRNIADILRDAPLVGLEEELEEEAFLTEVEEPSCY